MFNYLNIRKGEKLMNPDFGTIIWDSLFDPFDDNTKQKIMQDVRRIISYDNRVSAQNVTVTQFERGIQIEVGLVYIANGQTGTMQMLFDQNSTENTQSL